MLAPLTIMTHSTTELERTFLSSSMHSTHNNNVSTLIFLGFICIKLFIIFIYPIVYVFTKNSIIVGYK